MICSLYGVINSHSFYLTYAMIIWTDRGNLLVKMCTNPVEHFVYRQWFLEVFLGPFSNVNNRIMPMSDAVSFEGPKTPTSNKGLRPCPLRTEISPVSLILLMMLCTVDDAICKAFAIWHWEHCFSSILVRTRSQIGEPLPILLRDSA